jgi:hypothetical protein
MKIHWLGLAIVSPWPAARRRSGISAVALVLLPLAAWYASRIIVHGGFGLWDYATRG